MRRLLFRAAATVLLALAPAAGAAAELKGVVHVDLGHPAALRTMFATYGFRPGQCLSAEGGGVRFRIPSGVAGPTQTGIYSHFSLSGDFEVVLSYELVRVQTPQGGYGSGVGLAVDAGEAVGRGSIQRLDRSARESGYALQTGAGKDGQALKEEYQFMASSAQRGRMGVRRVKKELIFLASDDPSLDPQEIGRLPFADGTIRAVRLFADAGGSPTAVDARLTDVAARAEEVTGGVPKREAAGWGWWWLAGVVPVAGLGLAFWRWCAHRRRAND